MKTPGWKNIKDHYRIEHIVQILDGAICIGSPYISDLIKVSFDGAVSWGSLGPSHNDDLARYYTELIADPAKLRSLIDAPNTFVQSLTVFTYDGAEIIEKQCEKLGWPNVTHDGCLQYENTFSSDRDKVVKWAKENAGYGIKSAVRRVGELEADLAKARRWLAEETAILEKLNKL